MHYCLLILIRLYWLIPAKHRRRCIFTESCSRHVFRIAEEQGYKKAILALKERRLQCRPGYYRLNQTQVRLADNSIVPASTLNEKLI